MFVLIVGNMILFKMIPIIYRVIAPYSGKITLEREIDFEMMIKNRIIPRETMLTMKCKDILPDILAFFLLKENISIE